jgi:hypothetical protein
MRIEVERLSRFPRLIALVFLESGGPAFFLRGQKMLGFCAVRFRQVRPDGFAVASAASGEGADL